MFDNYKDSQNNIYYMIKNSIKLNRISHAYLIDSNNFGDIKNLISSLVKLFACPYNYSNTKNCGNCNQCSRIDNGNYSEVRYIYPDGMNIKKDQLLELQEEFNLSSIEGRYRIYVIWNCEKMNVQASNSMLKFLEEPNSNIIAILVTSNVDELLPTIVSRCQYIKLNNFDLYSDSTLLNVKRILNECLISDSVDDERLDFFICSVLDFVLFFEENGIDTLIYLKKLWYDVFTDRNGYLFGFQLIIQLYYDILKYKLNGEFHFYMDYKEKVIRIAEKLNFFQIIRRILLYLENLELVRYNLNLNLLMDHLIIELGESI